MDIIDDLEKNIHLFVKSPGKNLTRHRSLPFKDCIKLTKLGMAEVMRMFGLQIKGLAYMAAVTIKSNLSSLVKTERLTIDGDTADWLVIRVRTNGHTDKYCFRQLIDGIWISKIISE